MKKTNSLEWELFISSSFCLIPSAAGGQMRGSRESNNCTVSYQYVRLVVIFCHKVELKYSRIYQSNIAETNHKPTNWDQWTRNLYFMYKCVREGVKVEKKVCQRVKTQSAMFLNFFFFLLWHLPLGQSEKFMIVLFLFKRSSHFPSSSIYMYIQKK